MKKIQVDVCVCTACVMNGSVNIIESIESLRDLRDQLNDGLEAQLAKRSGEIEVTTNKCLGGEPHPGKSPMVSINGEVFAKADSESVMSHIIELFQAEE